MASHDVTCNGSMAHRVTPSTRLPLAPCELEATPHVLQRKLALLTALLASLEFARISYSQAR